MLAYAVPRIPITLLTGFLGSGKTTLLNRLLASNHAERIAIVVNEFGDVSIDGSLVVGTSEDLIELQNGCICCTIRGDMRETVAALLERRARRFWRRIRFDRIVIEASGVASPGPVVQTFLADPELSERTRVDGVVALAHAAHVKEQLAFHPEACQQIGYADTILLNHCDRSDDAGQVEAETALRRINPMASIVRTEHAELPPDRVLHLETTDPGRWKLDLAEADPSEESSERDGSPHGHTAGMSALTLRTRRTLDIHRLRIWLQFVGQRRTWELMRLKGIVRCRDHGPRVVVQGIYQWMELRPEMGAAPDESLLVLIGRDLDHVELRKGWEAVTGVD
ncbi:MAG: cobalamin biosynthesis protein CobW [Gemmatimonadetes bacterium]|nr:cobalamin biosynthesis protein CobW [Gemmatimonadota bacterium]